MIISRTPFRISLFGGGTDYPEWFLEHGGAVLGMAIDKYCYLTVRSLPPFFAHKHRIVYSNVELVQEISEIQHPAVRAILGELNVTGGVEIHHDADLPARSGLGSSSSFSVGLLHDIHASRGKLVTKRALCEEAMKIEQKVLNECVGCQDQIWAAYGGLNRIDFRQDGSFSVNPLVMGMARRQELVGSIMLFFTGFSRFASEVAKEQIAQIDDSMSERHKMQELVDEASSIISGETFSIPELGQLLHDSWTLKKQFSDNVSNDKIDEIYDAACDAGALGGKLLGAGGGGFIVFVAEPEKQAAIRERLKNLVYVDFDIDNDGSKIVVYEPGGLNNV
ncbi:MAG: kinase [Rhodospirillales bacterium]|jgi:D-glycero-alpha-D-manno-heptose-7-phosphate kinase|nr:kinase [Rhodospirillales bacterium]MBT4006542.1 kinase [Rhodospirillales bacterium]MBT5077209.1 kinase [Rhodospirillales bacterium]MBT5113820.1 kinase [Rhodospirillales bacterium]MBT5672348.1 kinase [Rhodospirillales bacterium]